MKQFMSCICDDDISTLIVSGEPTAEQLAEAWTNLFYEYCDLAGSHEIRHRAKLEARVGLMTIKYKIAKGWLDILGVQYEPELAEALRVLGYEYKLDPTNLKQYKNDLERIGGHLRSLNLDLKLMTAELDVIKRGISTQDTVGKDFFYTMFDVINDFRKREVLNEKSTVMQYAIALSRYVRDTETLNKA